MRNYDGLFELRPSLMGTVSAIGGTYIGAPVDTLGFNDILGVLVLGNVNGSDSGALATVTVKMQEATTAEATGTAWTDITDSSLGGSFAFTAVSVSATTPQFYKELKYTRLDKNARSRYLRAHASVAGTVGIGPNVSVAFLLGRPGDTLSIQNAATYGTGSTEYTLIQH